MILLEASELGPSAARALELASRWRVEHAFRQAAYAARGEEVVHLAASSLPLGPLTARLRVWRTLTPGQWVEVDRRGAQVRTWRFPPSAPLSAVAAAIAAARAVLPPAALAPGDLADPEHFADAARRLAGVGPGLTPAGDDVLAGVLLGLALTGGDVAGAWRAMAPAVRASTPIARAYLRAAAGGECAHPVARVLDAAMRGDAEEAVRHAPGLAAWGATTGPALLAGFAAGISLKAAGAWADLPNGDPDPSPWATSERR